MMESFRERRARLDGQVSAMGAALGQVLQRRMREREWIDEDLAWRAGLAPSTVNKLVRGARDNPTMETLFRVAYAFDITPETLLAEMRAEAARALVAVRDQKTHGSDNAKGTERAPCSPVLENQSAATYPSSKAA